MTIKVKKTDKKDNINNDITEHTKAMLEEIQDHFNEGQSAARQAKEKFTNKMKDAGEEIPNFMQSFNKTVMEMQQQLFEINMNFYSKSLTCYSFSEMSQLYNNYANQMLNCCVEETDKVNDIIFKANNDFVKQMCEA